jgi:folate-binding protein YgfZ
MTSPTPLHALHERLGARLAEADGVLLPLDYGDPAGEHAAVRGGAGLLDRWGQGVIEATGRDRAAFLHGMVTNDVKGLRPGQGCQAAQLDAHGKVLALMVVHCLADRLLLEMDRTLVAPTLEALERLHFSERVELDDATGREAAIGVAGPAARKVLEAALARPLPDLAAWHHVVLEEGGEAVRVVRDDASGEEGYDLWGAPAPVAALWERAAAAGARPVGRRAWEGLRVEAGTLRYGVDVDAGTLLLEAPLAGAYSLTKGCYVGQEVVARVTYRGHVNRRIVGLRFAGAVAPPPGAPVWAEGREAGRVTSATVPPGGRGLALATLRREHAEPGTPVTVRDAAGLELAAEVAALPLLGSGAGAAPHA